jgi:Cysteine-rich CPCC
MEPSPEEMDRRRRWFDWYVEHQAIHSTKLPAAGGPYHCPCCGCRTLDERGGSDICPVCFWEDDGQDEGDAEVVRGGPNGALSLTQARENYLRFGACEEDMVINVRPPLPDELS